MTLLDGNTFTAVLTTVLGTTVLRVSGEVDSATSERLRAHLDDLLDVDDPPMSLVVDVSGMTFIDTTG
ncbi:MAG: STAS domain-containing protein, partial [Actinobacteria bacterium]|nr:STAS domain-containing protein [Actinomycetota bacterium]